METDLTIIIPNYNNAKFLEKCLDSVINNQYKKYEVIVIDDHSNDASLKIIKRYAKKYEQITYIENSENKGAGFCRNRALELCKTKYVTFLDSDDYVEVEYYFVLMKKIRNNDVIVADIMLIEENNKLLAPSCEGKVSKENVLNNGFAASPCNKIFKTELIKQYAFGEGMMNEDVCTVLSCLIHGKIIYCNEVFYNYVQHKSSIQNTKLSLKRLDIFKAFQKLISYNPKLEKTWYDAIFLNQIIFFLFYVVPKEKSMFTQIRFLRKFNKEFSKYYKEGNKALQDFLSNQSKLHQLYYRMLIQLSKWHLSIFLTILIKLYKMYKKYFTKCVLKKNYTLEELKKVAIKNQNHTKDVSLTVVIPNYNYEKFLLQRLYSILYQKIKISKIVILDDKSADQSVEIIQKIKTTLKNIIPIEFLANEKNSGSAFKQWEKGIKKVQTKYVWIAEADDYCDKNFLKILFNGIEQNENISLAYTNTAFINQEGKMIRRSVVPDIDIQKCGHWSNSYINDGKMELRNYSYLNCTIANVSSVILNTEYAKKSISSLHGFKQAGDWSFYNNMMTLGNVLYIHKNWNYYRVHGNNATTLNKKQMHFNEIKKIHQTLNKSLKFTKKQQKKIEERYTFLEEVWGIER